MHLIGGVVINAIVTRLDRIEAWLRRLVDEDAAQRDLARRLRRARLRLSAVIADNTPKKKGGK